jgi:hypothetical protein
MWDELGAMMGGSDNNFHSRVDDEVRKLEEDFILE